MSQFYNRKGEPIDVLTWGILFDDTAYKILRQTCLPDGKWVSTVWLGINYNYGEGPPLIFETMVFPSTDDLSEIDMERYATAEQAEAGHVALVEKWTSNGSA